MCVYESEIRNLFLDVHHQLYDKLGLISAKLEDKKTCISKPKYYTYFDFIKKDVNCSAVSKIEPSMFLACHPSSFCAFVDGVKRSLSSN